MTATSTGWELEDGWPLAATCSDSKTRTPAGQCFEHVLVDAGYDNVGAVGMISGTEWRVQRERERGENHLRPRVRFEGISDGIKSVIIARQRDESGKT